MNAPTSLKVIVTLRARCAIRTHAILTFHNATGSLYSMAEISQPSLFDDPPQPKPSGVGSRRTGEAQPLEAAIPAAECDANPHDAIPTDTAHDGAPTIAALPPVKSTSSLRMATTAFAEHLTRAGKTENTRRAFVSDLGLLAEHIGAQAPVGTIDSDALRRYLTWMREHRGRPCSAKTYARRVTSLKVFFSWLAQTGAVPDDPARPLIHRRAEPPLPLILDDTMVAQLLAVARLPLTQSVPDARPALLVRLLLDTGLKKGELVRLRAADLATEDDGEGSTPSLLVRYDDPRWAEKERRVELSEHVAPLLRAYMATQTGAARLFDCTARNLEYVLAELVAQADLPPRTSFETLRWTSALRAWRAGVEEEHLREELGLSAITWAGTRRKLALLAGTAGPERVQGRWFGA